MKYKLFTKKSLFLALAAFAMLATSCINEDLAECSKLTLKVEGLSSTGEILDITRLGDVTDATLYIFDENKKLLETRELEKDFILAKEEIKLDKYPDNTKLHIIAWGNLKGGNQTVTQPQNMDELKLQLKSSADGYAQSPDSLFFGTKDVTSLGSGIVGGDGEVVIRLKTGTYTIKTIGLPASLSYYGLKSTSDFNFYIDRTLDTYSNAGVLEGDSVAYNPEGTYDTVQEWMTTGMIDDPSLGGKQNAFAGENLGVRIVSNNGSIDKTVYEAEDITTGEIVPLSMSEGGRMDVWIQFEDGNISARVRITPWGVVNDDIEF